MKIFPVYYFCIDELYFVTYLIKQPRMHTFTFSMYRRVTLTITYPEGLQGMSLVQWHKVFYSNHKSNNVATLSNNNVQDLQQFIAYTCTTCRFISHFGIGVFHWSIWEPSRRSSQRLPCIICWKCLRTQASLITSFPLSWITGSAEGKQLSVMWYV